MLGRAQPDAYPKVQEDYVTGLPQAASSRSSARPFARCCSQASMPSPHDDHRERGEGRPVGVDRLVPNADRLRVHIDVTFHALAQLNTRQ